MRSIAEIARELNGIPFGDEALEVVGIAEPAAATRDHLALAMSPGYAGALVGSAARAALISRESNWEELGLAAAIAVENPRLALAIVSRLFAPALDQGEGLHPQSDVAPSAVIGRGASVGPFSRIGENAQIGEGCRIASNCTIEAGARIGRDAVIHSGARIGRESRIGERFICHANAVIGSDGFSFAHLDDAAIREVRSSLGGKVGTRQSEFVRVHSLGHVEIGDDVEIGACCAIDRGTVAATVIGDGTKLDNLVHIAHNVRIGRNCLICGHVGIAGSAVIGDRVTLAGMSGVSDHVKVGSDVVGAGASKIYSDVPSGTAVMGSPAVRMDRNVAMYKSLRRLPRLFDRFRALEKKVASLLASD